MSKQTLVINLLPQTLRQISAYFYILRSSTPKASAWTLTNVRNLAARDDERGPQFYFLGLHCGQATFLKTHETPGLIISLRFYRTRALHRYVQIADYLNEENSILIIELFKPTVSLQNLRHTIVI